MLYDTESSSDNSAFEFVDDEIELGSQHQHMNEERGDESGMSCGLMLGGVCVMRERGE